MSENTTKLLEGIRGWLIVLLVIYIINIMIAGNNFITFISYYSDGTMDVLTDPASLYYVPNIGALVMFDIIGTIIVAVLLLVLIYLMFAKKKIFTKAALIFYIFSLSFAGLDLIFSNLVIPGSVGASLVGQFVGSIVHAIIWIAYLRRSVRVENTFVN